MVSVTSTPPSTDELKELLALIEKVSLSSADVEHVVAATHRRASTLATGPDSPPSITINVEVPHAADSNLLDADEAGGNSESDSSTAMDTPDPIAPVVLSEHYTVTHKNVVFFLPKPNVPGPYHLITKGRAIGVIAGWHHASPLVSEVSGAVHCKVKCLTRAWKMMETAINDCNTMLITAAQH